MVAQVLFAAANAINVNQISIRIYPKAGLQRPAFLFNFNTKTDCPGLSMLVE